MFNLFKNGMGTGIAIGVGATFLMPITARILASVAKPLMKESIKTGYYIYDMGKTYMAEARETFEDLNAEARSEMNPEEKPSPASKKAGEKAAEKK